MENGGKPENPVTNERNADPLTAPTGPPRAGRGAWALRAGQQDPKPKQSHTNMRTTAITGHRCAHINAWHITPTAPFPPKESSTPRPERRCSIAGSATPLQGQIPAQGP
eukprot:scaffold252580_cov27-Tisochrysis_lutea.AAC.2